MQGWVEALRLEAPSCVFENPNKITLIMGTILIQILIQFPVQKLSYDFFMLYLPAKKFPVGSKLRHSKAEMIAERVYKLIMHTVTTVALFAILKNSRYLPKYLLGDYQDPQYWENYPCQVLPNYLDDLYVIKLSYHVYEQIYAMGFQYNRRDFAEISLHHIFTIFLVLFSYMSNWLPYGSMIMLIHDITDTIVSIFKLTVDITPTWVQATSYGLMFFGWVYFRLYIFPVLIYNCYA